MLRALLDRLPDQEIESHLLADEGEVVIDLVRHHGIVFWKPIAEIVGTAVLWILALVGPIQLGWLFIVGGLGLLLHAAYLAMRERRDVFVVTNMRVFRATGVFSVRIATMPRGSGFTSPMMQASAPNGFALMRLTRDSATWPATIARSFPSLAT